jgi:hypothetical protein
MFVKDSLTCYYTSSVNESLNKQWTEEKIKVVLDLITFFNKTENPNNVKSLETIMEDIDINSRVIVHELF